MDTELDAPPRVMDTIPRHYIPCHIRRGRMGDVEIRVCVGGRRYSIYAQDSQHVSALFAETLEDRAGVHYLNDALLPDDGDATAYAVTDDGLILVGVLPD